MKEQIDYKKGDKKVPKFDRQYKINMYVIQYLVNVLNCNVCVILKSLNWYI